MTVRVAIRSYSGDHQRHVYPVEQLNSPDRTDLVPVCREFPYPRRHLRGMVSADDFPALGDSFVSCGVCWVWARRHQHTVCVRGTVTTP
jgi:hypothetical protein